MSECLRIGIHWISPTTYLRDCVSALASADPSMEIALTFVAGLETNTAYEDELVIPENVSFSVLNGPRDDRTLRRFYEDPFTLHIFSGRRIPAYRSLARALAGRARRAYVTDHPIIVGPKLFRGSSGSGRLAVAISTVLSSPATVRLATLMPWDSGHPKSGLAHTLPHDRLMFQRSKGRDAFIFVGRLVEEKGVRYLAEGYTQYRAWAGPDAWSMVIVGIGPLATSLQTIEGVTMRGFLRPSQLWSDLLAARAFVLPSLFEPWGVVLHEAALAELPLVASVHCGAAAHFLRDGWNGWLLRSVDANAIANALISVHQSAHLLETMGKRSAELAKQFTPEQWAATVIKMARG